MSNDTKLTLAALLAAAIVIALGAPSMVWIDSMVLPNAGPFVAFAGFMFTIGGGSVVWLMLAVWLHRMMGGM